MWLPGAGVGGEDLTAKNAKGANKRGLTTKVTKKELKKVNHKGPKEHIGREARKIKFLRPLRSLRLNHPKGTAIAVPVFVTFVPFVANLFFLLVPAGPR